MSNYRFVILVIAISLFTVLGFAQDRGKEVVSKGEKSVQSQPYAEGTLIKAKGASETYVIKKGKKCYVPDPATFASRRYQWDKVVEVEAAVLNKIPTGNPLPSVKYYKKATFPDGTLIKAMGLNPIYVIQKGKKCLIPDKETFLAKGYKGNLIAVVDISVLNSLPSGPPLPSLKK
jgi:hypothetical protein